MTTPLRPFESAPRPRRPRRGASPGFTVIELMITLVIAGIVLAVGVPSLNNLILGTRIKSAASDVYNTLVLARSEAIKRGTNVTITPVSSLWTNGWQVTAGATVLLNQDAVSKLKIQCPSGTNCAQTLVYRRDGRLNGASTVSIVVDETTPPSPRRVPMRCVNVNVSGQINVQIDKNMDGNCSNG